MFLSSPYFLGNSFGFWVKRGIPNFRGVCIGGRVGHYGVGHLQEDRHGAERAKLEPMLS